VSNTKPWEEEWTFGPNYIAGPDSGVTLEAHLADGPERRRLLLFVHAAPDMARALRGLFKPGEDHFPGCGHWIGKECDPKCSAVRAALAKAGVPLP
jgi:hypothetical protein